MDQRNKRPAISIKFLLLSVLFFLSSCSSAVVLHSKGQVGSAEKTLMLVTAGLMLFVVLPALCMTFLFAWKYRASHKLAKYSSEFIAEKRMEIVIWTIPTLIVLILSVLVWRDSHILDPYRPLQAQTRPLTIQVVSLDWKWLFIYPEQQIATMNLIVFPVNVPVHFYLTSATVMNSFFIPQLGSQIMTMGGMQTQLYLMANEPGTYAGISANFSGRGFTGMDFKAIACSEKEFSSWIRSVKKVHRNLDFTAYQDIANPSVNNPVIYFSSVQPHLFLDVIFNTSRKNPQ